MNRVEHAPDRPQTPEEQRVQYPEYILPRQVVREFVGINPGTEIVNKDLMAKNFGLDGKKFDIGRYNLPQVVWVQVSPTRKELLIEDGHHRSHEVDSHFDVITEKYPDFQFRVLNVTDFYLNQREDAAKRKPEKEVTPLDTPIIHATADMEPPALTIKEYLDALIGPTAAQPEVASLRVAMTLMKSWEGIIDNPATSDKFSALSAFSLLESIESRIQGQGPAKEAKVQAAIDARTDFFAGNRPGDVDAIKQGLHSLHDIMQGTKVKAKQVAQASVIIVSSKPDTLGGSKAVERQIAGLLHNQDIQQKFDEEYGHGQRRDQAFQDVSSAIVDSLQKRATKREVQGTGIPRTDVVKFRETMLRALLQPRISISQFLEIIGTEGASDEVDAKYRQILTGNIAEHLVEFITRSRQVKVLSDAETIIVNAYASSLAYDSSAIISPSQLRVIQEQAAYAARLFGDVNNLTAQIRDIPQNDGRSLARIEAAVERIRTCSNPALFVRFLSEFEDVIRQERTQLKMNELLDGTAPQDTTVGVKASDVIDVFVRLDNDLQRQVKGKTMTLAQAVIVQKRRDEKASSKTEATDADGSDSTETSRAPGSALFSEGEGTSLDALARLQGIKLRLSRIPEHDVVGPVREGLLEILQMVLTRLDPTGGSIASLNEVYTMRRELGDLRTRYGAAEALITQLEERLAAYESASAPREEAGTVTVLFDEDTPREIN